MGGKLSFQSFSRRLCNLIFSRRKTVRKTGRAFLSKLFAALLLLSSNQICSKLFSRNGTMLWCTHRVVVAQRNGQHTQQYPLSSEKCVKQTKWVKNVLCEKNGNLHALKIFRGVLVVSSQYSQSQDWPIDLIWWPVVKGPVSARLRNVPDTVFCNPLSSFRMVDPWQN